MPYIGNTLVTTVSDESITFAKMQDAAGNTVLVRNSGSSGDISALAIASGQVMVGNGSGFTSTAVNDLLAATDIKIGEDDQTKIDFETPDEIHFYAANVEQVYVADNIFGPQSDSDVDLGTTSVRWKDAFVDSLTVTGAIGSGAITVDDVAIDGKIITMTGSTDDTAVLTVAANGALSLVTTDTAAAAANITITADGTFEVDGTTITLDSAGDIVLDADGADLVFADGGTNLLKITNSSSDVVFQPQVDAKDIKFNQYDGNLLLDINDGGWVGVHNAAAGPGELRFYEDTDLGSHYTGFKAANATASVTYILPAADSSGNLQSDGSGNLSWATASAGVSLGLVLALG